MTVDGTTRDVDYFPGFSEIVDVDMGLIREDAPARTASTAMMNLDDSEGFITTALSIGDYYDAVGHTDSVFRVYRALDGDPELIPEFAQVFVDEYQDFSLLEASLIGKLSMVSPTLIAGDDDQALYGFKHASADYLRDLVRSGTFEKFELPFCTRCTQVLVDATHLIVSEAQAAGLLGSRLDKEYICYLPEKRAASELHSRIRHARCSVERTNAPYMCRYVAQQISVIDPADVEESHRNGNPTVLVIAPVQFGRRLYQHLTDNGFPNVEYRTSPQNTIEILDGYRRLVRDERSRLGWRLVLHCFQPNGWQDLVRRALLDNAELVDILPTAFRDRHLELVAILRHLLEPGELSAEDQDRLVAATGLPMTELRQVLGLDEASPPPEVDEDHPKIVITSMIGSKGLQAEHVYVVGLNDQHFPRDNAAPTEDEVCQLLVALTRARQSCTLVSCDRFGQEPVAQSVFLRWLDPLIDTVTVNAAYWNS